MIMENKKCIDVKALKRENQNIRECINQLSKNKK